LQEPDDDGGQENDSESALQEVFGFFPQQQPYTFGAGEPVVGQLHHKGDGLAAEGGVIHDEGRHDADEDAEKIKGDHHQGAVLREKCRRKKGVDGDFGRAAHVRGEENGHFAVAIGGDGAGGHDGRHRAAEADEQRHDAAARKTDAAQRLIHYKGDTGHVAGVFQDGEKEKQGDDDGQEHQHAAHAGKDAIDDEAVDHRIDAVGSEGAIDQGGERINADGQEIGKTLADDMEGEVEGEKHDRQKGGNGGVPAGKDLIEPDGAGVLAAFVALGDRGGDDPFDEGIAHIGQGGIAVQPGFVFHLDDAVFQQFLFVFIQPQVLFQRIAALNELGGAEPGGDAQPFGVIRDEVDNGVQAAVNGGIIGAEICDLG